MNVHVQHKPPTDKFGVPRCWSPSLWRHPSPECSPTARFYSSMWLRQGGNQGTKGDHPTALQGCQPHAAGTSRSSEEAGDLTLCDIWIFKAWGTFSLKQNTRFRPPVVTSVTEGGRLGS